ncbi:MAG: AAA family ATPase, partial [Candidatus Cryptobacteroides sp.]
MLYPIGIQNFEKIRKDGYVYVDKTDLVYKLAKTGGYYFLSRPRRFGKSLLISTLEAYFSGKKELFEGLKIADLEKDWIEYPVLRMDFSGRSYDSQEVLQEVFDDYLSRWEKMYGVDNKYTVPGIRFSQVIEAAYIQTGQRVVILIDEYDKPIMDNLGNEDISDIFRNQLQGFYSVMKAKDGFIQLGFLTGVTKIGKLSIFSGLNNLKDISMDARYTDICGISENNLTEYFSESVKELAEANDLTVEEAYNQLAEMYDGYHFCEDSTGIYNPFSVLNTLDSKRFKEYWFETGTPSFLVKVMKDTDYDVTRLSFEQADTTLLTDIDSAFNNPIPLLYQSGYLTIKDYDKKFGIYTLGFPNQEVKHGFLSYLLNYYTSAKGSGNLLIRQMNNDLLSGRPKDFMKRMESFFARQNYQIQGNAEKDFQYAMSIILQLLSDSISIHSEESTSDGRIDILAETPLFVYIIEIKVNASAE